MTVIEIILKAKNSMASGLSSAGSALKSFGTHAWNVGKMIGTSLLSAGGVIVGLGVKAVSAFADAESKLRSLTAALGAHGEKSDLIIPKLKDIAQAIKDETGASDDSTIAGMARMRMLGVQTEKLGEAAKAVLALKAVGIEEAAAQKAVSLAMQGNYAMLARHVPALRNAKTETEKAIIVNQLFARGYEQQKELLKTVSGRYADLKDNIGEMWEEVGAAIAQNDTLAGALEKVSGKVKELTAKISEWVNDGGIERWTFAATAALDEVSTTFALMGNDIKFLWAGIRANPFSYLIGVVNSFIATGIAGFTYLADTAASAWEVIRTGSLSAWKKPDTGPMLAAAKQVADALTFKESNDRFADVMQARLRIEMEYAERARAREQEYANTVAAISAKRVANAKKTAEQITVIGSAALDDQAADEESAEEIIEKLHDDRVASVKAMRDEISTAEQTGVDEVVSINEEAAAKVGETWKEIWRRRLAASRGGSTGANGVYDLSGSNHASWLTGSGSGSGSGYGGNATYGSNAVSNFLHGKRSVTSRSKSGKAEDALFSPSDLGTTGTTGASAAKGMTQGEAEIVRELKGMRAEHRELMRMG